ncbi:isocitrate lyase/phosphoenolpyruvate mutase family protein [Chitinophaga varians]|uniref:Isocitrate lyase/phosphoenolpyruvate mutase family protein n=1 Tax=Chitinophaga varians TaxID=2202339 RepID=A0A847S6C0_9BACT|nr:isocitrate lyase/phosphoenolpyruvate mutase family protein [Chitinophaga varians]NLR68945.1 isocitrate lyase/phosphoenolpyruvate mutase family protein [Chitinophaga varians]
MSVYEQFKQLHHQETPLLLSNAWDVASARVMQEKGVKAIATSSSAIADTLGYADGQNISFGELLHIIRRIVACVEVPVSADIEAGYASSTEDLLANIDLLVAAGVAGINLEDSAPSGTRTLLPADDLVKKISAIKSHLAAKGQNLFINARTDTFLLDIPGKLEETFVRARLYAQAGADGLFVPFIKDPADIEAVVSATTLPVNVLAMKGLAGIAELNTLGVKRISMGGSMYWAQKRALGQRLEQVIADGGFESVF